MSIIEKAVDKLSGGNRRKDTGGLVEHSANEVDVAQNTREPGPLQEAFSGAPPAPIETLEGSETETLGGFETETQGGSKEPGSTETEAVAAFDEGKHQPEQSDTGTETVDIKPEIRFSELDLEGILSPEGGRSRLDEEYRMIKRPLLVRASSQEGQPGVHLNLIMLSSALSGEGKTFTTLNLAISIAMELDRTVLLIDADLAKPGLSRILGIKDLPGFTECLLEESLDLGGFLLNTDIPKLKILPAGEHHNRATELLSSNAMRSRLNELATRYSDRIILFDSPPLLATSEASVLASYMGQVAVVVEYGVTPQYLVKEALGLFQSLESVSVILNKTRDELFSGRSGGYSYGYGKGYGYGSYGDG